jgi:hypothetical protein
MDEDGDGVTDDNITADWMNASIVRGFADPLARVAQTGRATFTLNNALQKYSPELYPNQLPRRKVKFTMDAGSGARTLFEGYIESIAPTPGTKRERRARFECVDAMALLDMHDGAIAIQLNAHANEIVLAVVGAVFSPPTSVYDDGLNLFPLGGDRWTDIPGLGVGFEEITASRRIQDAVSSDWGHFFIRKNGGVAFRNRHHLPLVAGVRLVLNDQMAKMTYRKAASSVYNLVEVTVHPRAVGQTLEVLGRLSQSTPPPIEPGESVVFVVDYQEPTNKAERLGGKDVVTPVANTDYTCTSDEAGDGDDLTASVSASMTAYADRAEVTLSNAASEVAYVQNLQVRGYAIRVRNPVTLTASDPTSIAAYQKRKLRIDAPLLSSIAAGQRLADYLLACYKDPHGEVRSVEFLANKNATFLAAAAEFELLERVTLTESQTGLSGYDGYAYQIRHDIKNKWEHRVTLEVAPTPSVTGAPGGSGTPFRLDTSALNSGHVLIY